MSLRLSRLVPEEKDKWYYDSLLGLLLYNNSERGWVAVSNKEALEKEFEELQEALDSMEEFNEPSEVLPLPDDYEDAYHPVWEQ